MIILSANNLTKTYGTESIIAGASFHVKEGDRIGIVGVNGAGKTTLLNILAGEMKADEGEFYVSGNTTVGYLKQSDSFNTSNTVIEEVDAIYEELHRIEKEMHSLSDQIAELSAKSEGAAGNEEVEKLLHRLDQLRVDFENKDGYSYKSEMMGVLASMAFGEESYNKRISSLSGGERTRLSLACLLLRKPNILFLDEPTNHLDIGTLKWLEQYLKSYKGTILLISHDRYFLDQTVNRIFEIENRKLCVYEGNYSVFAEKKKRRREEEWNSYNAQQREVQRQTEIIRRFKQHGTEKLAKRAASREKRLAQVEIIDRPESETGKIKIRFKQNFKSGNDVLMGENLSKSFGYGQNNKKLFSGVDFDIKKGERICIVGANGIGKTTLLRIMMEELIPDCGYLKIGHNVVFGYYDQRQQLLNTENTVMDEVHNEYRLYSDTEIRSLLGRFLFKNDRVALKVRDLSGGERARLALLKLMLSGANVLILDEPTNHLDIDSKEIFEEALLEFAGTVIVVSHDRYFLNRIPTRILELEEDGLINYLGSYNYYIEKKQSIDSGKKYLAQMKGAEVRETRRETADSVSSAEERRLKKEKEAVERRRAREIQRLEQEIEELEQEQNDIIAAMCAEENLSNHQKLAELHKRSTEIEKQLEDNYAKWEEIAAE